MAPLALGVVVAGLVAGCGGGDDKSDDGAAAFKKSAASLAAKTSLVGDDLGTAISTASTKTDAQLTATFTDLTSRARSIVTQLKALEPTDSARQKVADLAEALDVGANDLDTIAKAAANSDADAAKSATQKLVTDSPTIKQANDALKSELTTTSK
jgi:hypothetical protein